jgi:ferric-dicitrate binding protein FerR (iron transport regulator)
MRGTKTVSKTASQIPAYVRELAENEYARENLRKGAESLREGARALADQREHPKRKWPKRLAAAGLAGAAAAGAAIAAKGSGSSNGAGGESQQ